MKRPSWDSYFLTIAKLTSKRSNCIKRQVGCIIVKNNRILSLGYNGTPHGTINCFEGGCQRCMHQSQLNTSIPGSHLDLCMCLHAEENAILFISQNEIRDSTMYVTLLPCIGCIKKIIQCGIKRIVFDSFYSKETDDLCLEILQNNSIEVIQKNENDL